MQEIAKLSILVVIELLRKGQCSDQNITSVIKVGNTHINSLALDVMQEIGNKDAVFCYGDTWRLVDIRPLAVGGKRISSTVFKNLGLALPITCSAEVLI